MNQLISLRVIKVSAACVLLFALMLSAAGCLNMLPAYSMSDATTVDNILYCTKKDDNSECVVIGTWWDGETTEIVYEIPDTFEGRSVTWLGDKITGFEIHQPSQFVSYDPKDGKIHQRYVSDPIADVNDGSLEITDVTVTFKLGNNIRHIGKISPDYLALMNGDEPSVYRVHVFFEISDDNPVYYSRDGVPYLKSTDEKADCAGFIGEF